MKFDAFNPKIGLYVAKYIDFSYLLCFTVVIIFNALFYSEDNTSLIIKMFLVISLVATILY